METGQFNADKLHQMAVKYVRADGQMCIRDRTPKQFLKVGGKTILETAALKFNKVEYVDEIIVVTNSDYIKKTMELLSKPSYNKVTKVIPGGRERQDSIFCGVKALGEIQCNDIVLIHDGARPFVEKNVIERCV